MTVTPERADRTCSSCGTEPAVKILCAGCRDRIAARTVEDHYPPSAFEAAAQAAKEA